MDKQQDQTEKPGIDRIVQISSGYAGENYSDPETLYGLGISGTVYFLTEGKWKKLVENPEI